MGTPRRLADGSIDFEISDFEISDMVSLTLDNMRENKAVVFMAHEPAARARDFRGARIHAQVTNIQTEGDKLEQIRSAILQKHGAQKAGELQAAVNCSITRVRPVVAPGSAGMRRRLRTAEGL